MTEAGKRELADSWAGCLFCILVDTGHTEREGDEHEEIHYRGLPSWLASSVTSHYPPSTPNVNVQLMFQFPMVFFLSSRPLQMLFLLPHILPFARPALVHP